MRHRGILQPGGSTLFAALMVLAGAVLLIPPQRWRSGTSPTQLLAFVQEPAARAARLVTGGKGFAPGGDGPRQASVDESLSRVALENQAAALSEEAARLRTTLAELTGIRNLAGFPRHARLIPASVVARDAVPSRDGLKLNRGSRAGVQAGSWVATRLVVQPQGSEHLPADAAVLARESLIGWVEQESPFTSRVVLLSDRIGQRGIRVHITRPAGGAPVADPADPRVPANFLLVGAGNGRMRIEEIDARLVAQGHIQTGDLVTCDPRDPRLPVAMVIGHVSEIRLRRSAGEKPLLCDLLVEPRVAPERIDEVYVVDIGPASAGPPTAR